MRSDVPVEELSSLLDDVAYEALAQARVLAPPVDALALADRLGIAVATDGRQRGRARFVRLARDHGTAIDSILLRPEPRWERRQWAVAHEIGEWLAHRVFAELGVDPREAPIAMREQTANLLASRLLLPTDWFAADGERQEWDLLALKQLYRTASNELLARRMLDFSPPIIVTVVDQGEITWRRSNVPGNTPALAGVERDCWRAAHESGQPQVAEESFTRILAWPVHEPAWRREIVRTEAHAWLDDPF